MNDQIVRVVTASHRLIGLDITDERTTFLRAPFSIELSTDENEAAIPSIS